MADFFYIDANGDTQGPVSEEQLSELAAQGIITAKTPMSTDTGRRGTARQITDLFGAATKPIPTPRPKYQSISWQFNFATHLLTCKLVYHLSSFAAVIIGIAVTQRLLQVADAPLPGVGSYAVIAIVATWIGVVLSIASTRLFCEWSLITSKAAQMYVEKTSQEKT